MTFRPELIDELLKEYRNSEDLMGEDGIFKQLTKALIERCLSAELDTHLAEEKAEAGFLREGKTERPRNRRNGYSKKTIKGKFGESEIGIPRGLTGMRSTQGTKSSFRLRSTYTSGMWHPSSLSSLGSTKYPSVLDSMR